MAQFLFVVLFFLVLLPLAAYQMVLARFNVTASSTRKAILFLIIIFAPPPLIFFAKTMDASLAALIGFPLVLLVVATRLLLRTNLRTSVIIVVVSLAAEIIPSILLSLR